MHSKCLIAILALTLIAGPAAAEFATPGLGVTYDMDALVAISGGAVTGSVGNYQIHDSVVISLNDQLDILSDSILVFMGTGGDIGFEINGGLRALGSPGHPIVFTGDAAVPGCWRGLDYIDQNANSQFHLGHVEIAYADIAVDVFGGDIILEVCDIHDCLDKAVDFTQAGGLVLDCHLHHNRQRTAVMTLSSSPTFERCILDNNNLDNSSPYPYFNVGLQGVNSPTISECEIDGSGNEMSGGMAFWNSSSASVIGNTIRGCGYGILCYSIGANPTIQGNIIEDNNIHSDTVNWGFGVAVNGDSAPVLAGNRISGHWYGVAAINGGQPNLGNIYNAPTDDDGLNIIRDNGIGGQTYGFFNNTPLDQMAQNNNWGPDGAEDSIQHQPDDPSLGLVTFDPVAEGAAAPEAVVPGVLIGSSAYPNPFNPRVEVKWTLAQDSKSQVVIFDSAGRLVQVLQDGVLPSGEHKRTWNGLDRQGLATASGVYFYRVEAGTESRIGKLTLVR